MIVARMSSKRRIRRISCEGKARHATIEHARFALFLSRKTGHFSGMMHSYRCSNCGGFHNGYVKHRVVRRWNVMNKKEFDR